MQSLNRRERRLGAGESLIDEGQTDAPQYTLLQGWAFRYKTLSDRRGLEQHSCECYGVVERAYEQLRSGSSYGAPLPGSSGEGRRTAHLSSPAA